MNNNNQSHSRNLGTLSAAKLAFPLALENTTSHDTGGGLESECTSVPPPICSLDCGCVSVCDCGRNLGKQKSSVKQTRKYKIM